MWHALTCYQAELEAFQEAHFGKSAIDNFSNGFLPHHEKHSVEQAGFDQEDEAYYEDYEDDGLGYYDDGVKRTLTDEQIAMFRHSELEALRRAQESQDSKTASTTKPTDSLPRQESGEQVSDGELPSEANAGTSKKKKRKRGKGRVDTEKPEKPDLRKRTWDVVETGLASLDYGDEPQESTAIARPAQRRHISYDD